MFVDIAKINIKSGRGGDGAVSFRREAYVPEGGPDGGDGGKGGDVVILADRNLRTLMDFRYKRKYSAENGENGKKKNQFGRDGEDLVIKVPVGTLVLDVASGDVMCDLVRDGQRFVAAKGGRGGRGNVRFKSPTRRTPNFAESGGEAQERDISLSLKLLADVGLVGYPNVGKSTLLSATTGALPKIADYHFTTLSPNLGVVEHYDSSFVIADIPGLIEGASKGVGLGHDFLKHIERTAVIVHVVDVSGFEGRNPVEDFRKVNSELSQYGANLIEKPQIVAANKMDIGSEDRFEEFKSEISAMGYDVYPISAVTGEGVRELIAAAYNLLQKERESAPELPVEAEFKVISPQEEADYKDIHVKREGDIYVVTGKQLRKIFDSTNFSDRGSLQHLHNFLERRGAFDKLKELGLEDGDTVRVFDFDFEYFE